MLFHFSIILKIFKKKGKKFDQKTYDLFFHNIENNLRELGFGDISVNKKMKDLNKILYDILLKIEKDLEENKFKINPAITIKYFKDLKSHKNEELSDLNDYFTSFFNFCFELPLESMIRDSINFKF